MINEKDLTIVLDNQCEMKIEDDVQDVLIAENQEGEAKTEITQVEQEIKKQIIERDNIDKNRSIAPLVVPHDAIIVDSTNLNIDEVTKITLKYINEHISNKTHM